jgi:hypothetical protein
VVLSTGKAQHAASAVYVDETMFGEPLNSTETNADPDFSAALTSMGLGTFANKVYDPATLAFDLVSSKTGVLQWQYVMGSTEYGVFDPAAAISDSYIDAFVMSVKAPSNSIGTILTRVPGTSSNVAISTVNWATNSNSYTDNRPTGPQPGPGPLNTTVAGLTTLFMTQAYEVQAGVRYRVKLVVADVGDGRFDTMVWVKTKSLQVSCEFLCRMSATFLYCKRCACFASSLRLL